MESDGQIEVGTTFDMIAPSQGPIYVKLRYDVTNPYAVNLIFVTDAGSVAWFFARELLTGGLIGMIGAGDVKIWPWISPSGDSVALSVSSFDGDALFRAKRGALERFLRRTYKMVPLGRENDYIDFDGLIAAFLDEGSRNDT